MDEQYSMEQPVDFVSAKTMGTVRLLEARGAPGYFVLSHFVCAIFNAG